MSKSDSGIIAILANFNSPEMRKVLDLKITSGYPTITIPTGFRVNIPEQNISSQDFQHITIPPDLNIHLTGGCKDRLWAPKKENVVSENGTLIPDYQKIVTVIYPPISNFPVFENKSYRGGLIIAFSQLPHWNEHTGFVLELFAIKSDNVAIPLDLHYPGDQGVYMPWKYEDIGTTYKLPSRQGHFWIRQFAIANHDPKECNAITVHFW